MLAHRSSDMQQPPNNPVIAYIFAFLSLLLLTLDTGIQWYTVQGRSRKYLVMRVPLLAIILLGDIGLIGFIEVYRSRHRTDWLPALWVLLESSILLNRSIGAMVYHRMYNKLDKRVHLQSLARTQLFFAVAFVLPFDVLAFSFIVGGYKPYIAVILQATGSFAAHLFLSTLPLWFVSRGQSPRKMILTKRTWGVLCCSCATLAGAIASLGLLGLSDVYQKLLGLSIVAFVSEIPWFVLQAYKLVYKSEEDDSSARLSDSTS